MGLSNKFDKSKGVGSLALEVKGLANRSEGLGPAIPIEVRVWTSWAWPIEVRG